jgi:hypothetical protein
VPPTVEAREYHRQRALAPSALSAGAMVGDRVVRPMAVVIVGRA